MEILFFVLIILMLLFFGYTQFKRNVIKMPGKITADEEELEVG
jgi:hypothetical protein